MYKFKLLFALSILLINIPLYSQTEQKQIGIYENLGHTLSPDISLINESSQRVNLSALINKPTVLVLVYYRCPGICSPLLDGLSDLIKSTQLELGDDYQVLTISFDPSENIELAKKKKNNYIANIDRKNISEQWQFFTSDSININKLCTEVGFTYVRTGKDFTHAASLIILSPTGKITRYMKGTYFLPFEFKLAILESNKGQTGPTISRLVQYCYSYDPVGGSYTLDITKLFGLVMLFMAIIVFIILLFKKKRKRKTCQNL